MFQTRFDGINGQFRTKRYQSVKKSLIESISFHISVKKCERKIKKNQQSADSSLFSVSLIKQQRFIAASF